MSISKCWKLLFIAALAIVGALIAGFLYLYVFSDPEEEVSLEAAVAAISTSTSVSAATATATARLDEVSGNKSPITAALGSAIKINSSIFLLLVLTNSVML